MLGRFAVVLMACVALVLISATPGLPATNAVPDSATAGAPDKDETAEPSATGQPSAPRQYKKPSGSSYGAEDWTVALYPILVWAPVMGGSINVPDLPPIPTHPEEVPQGSYSGGLSGAAFFGVSIQKQRFVMDFSALYASVSGSQDNPKISIDTSFLFYDATAGIKLNRELSLSAGVRHLGLKIDATLVDFPQVTWKPNVTDPILGLEWRHSMGKKWGLDINIKGGGFGAGSDVDLSGTGRLDWRFARHFGLTMGYGGVHFQVTDQVTTSSGTLNREVKQTLHGPIFGFGIYF